mmetsp:Transcript_25731/g.35402  ORF Transcript_25731/g.35402 Transcript_25731/m.35402 type:complete len:99 (+) Transcript_25731:931-1227(+)
MSRGGGRWYYENYGFFSDEVLRSVKLQSLMGAEVYLGAAKFNEKSMGAEGLKCQLEASSYRNWCVVHQPVSVRGFADDTMVSIWVLLCDSATCVLESQ